MEREDFFIRFKPKYGTTWNLVHVNGEWTKEPHMLTIQQAKNLANLNRGGTAVPFCRRGKEIFALNECGELVPLDEGAVYGATLTAGDVEKLRALLR